MNFFFRWCSEIGFLVMNLDGQMGYYRFFRLIVRMVLMGLWVVVFIWVFFCKGWWLLLSGQVGDFFLIIGFGLDIGVVWIVWIGMIEMCYQCV